MTTIKSRRCRIYSVVHIHSSGITDSSWVENPIFRWTMAAPVIWNGQTAQLHFRNHGKSYAVNQTATDLFARTGFVIRGSALIKTGDELFYCVTTTLDKDLIEYALDGLGLSGEPIILPVDAWVPHTNIYVRDRNDAFALKMRLS